MMSIGHQLEDEPVDENDEQRIRKRVEVNTYYLQSTYCITFSLII